MGRFERDSDLIKFEQKFCNTCLVSKFGTCRLVHLHAKYGKDEGASAVLDEIIRYGMGGNECTLFVPTKINVALKPCPFCGSKPEVENCGFEFNVRCDRCGTSMRGSILGILVHAWNKRVEQ